VAATIRYSSHTPELPQKRPPQASQGCASEQASPLRPVGPQTPSAHCKFGSQSELQRQGSLFFRVERQVAELAATPQSEQTLPAPHWSAAMHDSPSFVWVRLKMSLGVRKGDTSMRSADPGCAMTCATSRGSARLRKITSSLTLSSKELRVPDLLHGKSVGAGSRASHCWR